MKKGKAFNGQTVLPNSHWKEPMVSPKIRYNSNYMASASSDKPNKQRTIHTRNHSNDSHLSTRVHTCNTIMQCHRVSSSLDCALE
jgi:hypothetical protein